MCVKITIKWKVASLQLLINTPTPPTSNSGFSIWHPKKETQIAYIHREIQIGVIWWREIHTLVKLKFSIYMYDIPKMLFLKSRCVCVWGGGGGGGAIVPCASPPSPSSQHCSFIQTMQLDNDEVSLIPHILPWVVRLWWCFYRLFARAPLARRHRHRAAAGA